MLTTKKNNVHDSIIKALRNFHITGQLTPTVGLRVVNNDVVIDYGLEITDPPIGAIRMVRGQFTIDAVSLPAQIGTFQTVSYNHDSEAHLTRGSYEKALKNNNLQESVSARSALIILTAECCRSEMVFRAIKRLISSDATFPVEVWNGLKFAFTNYAGTCGFLGRQINAGNPAWAPLTLENYQQFIKNSARFTGDKEKTLASINAVDRYISNPG